MVIVVIVALIAMLVFGDKLEKYTNDYLEVIYRDRADKDALKTHFVIHGFTYWAGTVALMCLLATIEVARSQSAVYSLVMSAMLMATFVVFAKITKTFRAMSVAREHALREYLSK